MEYLIDISNYSKYIEEFQYFSDNQFSYYFLFDSNRANNERRGSVSEGDSDEENEEGDYTVYECPGLAAVSF